MASVGPGGFYEAGFFADYPPGYLYVLWLLGEIGGALTPLVGQDATGGLVKIPGMPRRRRRGRLLFVIGSPLGRAAPRPRVHLGIPAETLGLVAATVYLFNPGVVFETRRCGGRSTAVGVARAAGHRLRPGAGLDRGRGASAPSWRCSSSSSSAYLIPIVLVVGLKRHLFGRSSDPEHRGAPDPLRVADLARPSACDRPDAPDPAVRHDLFVPDRRPPACMLRSCPARTRS